MATWVDFDLDCAVWSMPAVRMKMRPPHPLPFSRQALELFKALRRASRSDLLFPGVRSATRPISDGTLNAALRRLGYAKDELTAHAFRATASSLLDESGRCHPNAVERQLAHGEENDVGAAYARSNFWDQRVTMRQWWADELDRLRLANVV